MKRITLVLVLVSSAAFAASTTFVNVGTSATQMPTSGIQLRTSVLIENNGTNDLWCVYLPPGSADGTTPTITIGRGHKIAAGTGRAFPGDKIWCACSVAQNGTGSDTTAVSEISGT